jgi:hypothetical protein
MIDTATFAGLFWSILLAVFVLLTVLVVWETRTEAPHGGTEDDEAHVRRCLEMASRTGSPWPPPKPICLSTMLRQERNDEEITA